MKKELKYFLLGMAATFVGMLLFHFGLKLYNKITSKPENPIIQENKQTGEVVNGYSYIKTDAEASNGINSIKCEALKDVKQYNAKFIITNENELYEINMWQKFSENNENCQKITDIKIKSIILDYLLLGEDNKLYLYQYNENSKKYEIKEKDYAESIDNIYKKYLIKDDIISFKYENERYNNTDDSRTYTFNVIKTDGKLYRYVIFEKYNPSINTYSSKLESSNELYSFDGEHIKYYFSGSDMMSNSIVTDKNLYVSVNTNPECHDYVDMECEYAFVKDEYFTNKVNDMAYINNIQETYVNYYDKDGNIINISKTKVK